MSFDGKDTVMSGLRNWPMRPIGDFIRPFVRKNSENRELPFMGVNKDKELVPTVAKTENVDATRYSVLKKGEFVFSGMQTGRDVCIRIALSDFETDVLLSPAYTTFSIDSNELLAEYFFMNFKSPEMDRQGWFKSDSSVRSNLDWDRFCEIMIPVPPIEIQRMYVDTYRELTVLVRHNERLQNALNEVARACIVETRIKWPLRTIGQYIHPFLRRNSENRELPFMGVNKDKELVPTVAKTENVDATRYSVLKKGEFVFSGMQTGRDVCIRIALSDFDTDVLLSPAYTTFSIDSNELLAEYFFMNFKSPEMDRQGWFKSDSSVRSNLDWDRFCEIMIPVPPLEVQRAIVAMFHCAQEARQISKEANERLEVLCPALIQRSSRK